MRIHGLVCVFAVEIFARLMWMWKHFEWMHFVLYSYAVAAVVTNCNQWQVLSGACLKFEWTWLTLVASNANPSRSSCVRWMYAAKHKKLVERTKLANTARPTQNGVSLIFQFANFAGVICWQELNWRTQQVWALRARSQRDFSWTATKFV